MLSHASTRSTFFQLRGGHPVPPRSSSDSPAATSVIYGRCNIRIMAVSEFCTLCSSALTSCPSQGFDFELAEKGILNLIQLVLQRGSTPPDPAFCCASHLGGELSCGGDSGIATRVCVSRALYIWTSCDYNTLLSSAVSELLLLPIIIQCIPLSDRLPSVPPSVLATALLQYVDLDDVMAHPIARYDQRR
jgi:hypothetical protein